jgi:hypothetical protein
MLGTHGPLTMLGCVYTIKRKQEWMTGRLRVITFPFPNFIISGLVPELQPGFD